MRSFLLGAGSALVLGAATLVAPAAADGPNSWGGFYIGAHAGYGLGEHSGTGIYTDTSGSYNVLDPETGTVDLEGGIGGLQAGFNIQSGSLVYGLEGNFTWTGIEGNNTFISDDGNNGSTDYTWSIKTNLDWMASLRGRVGVLVSPSFLVYGTGGVAFANMSSNEKVVGYAPQGLNNETTVLASTSENLFGWVAGAGAEWALTPKWSVKAEWQYTRFDGVDSHFKGTAYPERTTSFAYDQDSFPGEIETNTVHVGINYKLN